MSKSYVYAIIYKLRTHAYFDLEYERALILSCSSCEASCPSSWQYMFDVGFLYGVV